jgi:pimeloyl-ACP methyl ester carboxylesterase
MADSKTFDNAARWRLLGFTSRLAGKFLPILSDWIALPLRLAAPVGALSSDPAMRAYLIDDALLGGLKVPSKFFRSFHNWRPVRADLSLDCPILLVHPGSDEWTPTALSLPTFERIPTSKRFVELSNGAHMPLEQPCRDALCEQIKLFLHATPTTK